jgi:hypothetical protein
MSKSILTLVYLGFALVAWSSGTRVEASTLDDGSQNESEACRQWQETKRYLDRGLSPNASREETIYYWTKWLQIYGSPADNYPPSPNPCEPLIHLR